MNNREKNRNATPSRKLAWVPGWGILGLLAIAAIGAAVWYWRADDEVAELFPLPPVFIFIMTPASGDELQLGDLVPVTINAVGLKPLIEAELFANGESLGVVNDSPENATWIWQPLSAGIHTLNAKGTSNDGEVGQSQTLIINVLMGDGFVQIVAVGGETLQQIGSTFRISLTEIAAANPDFDPDQPLPGGSSIQIPVGNGRSSTGTGASIPHISWQLNLLESADKAYCYSSTSDGNWFRIPKKPYLFLSGPNLSYIQHEFLPIGGISTIKMECWGWQGETLMYLGLGEAEFEASEAPDLLTIIGPGFQFTGKPQIPLQGSESGEDDEVPGDVFPPSNVRVTTSVSECTNHVQKFYPSGSPLTTSALNLCEEILNWPVLTLQAVMWEWDPTSAFPSPGQVWQTKADGFSIYEISTSPENKYFKLMIHIPNSTNKVWFVPIVFDPLACYGVTAYIGDPNLYPVSDLTHNC